jgi:hypothetical protein
LRRKDYLRWRMEMVSDVYVLVLGMFESKEGECIGRPWIPFYDQLCSRLHGAMLSSQSTKRGEDGRALSCVSVQLSFDGFHSEPSSLLPSS